MLRRAARYEALLASAARSARRRCPVRAADDDDARARGDARGISHSGARGHVWNDADDAIGVMRRASSLAVVAVSRIFLK